MLLVEALGPAYLRASQGWVKPDAAAIAAAREQALQSPIYHKLMALKGWKDSSTKAQIKNGTINFKVNNIIDVQCSSTLIVRYQGPDDHNSRRMDVPNELARMPIEEAYIAMLQLMYDKFKTFGDHHDVADADGYKLTAATGVDLSLKYRGISSLKGMNGQTFERVDLSGNALEDLACENVKMKYLLAVANPLKTLEGMPECQGLDIRHLPTVLDFEEEWQHIPKSLYRIRISAKSSKNISALFQCEHLAEIGLDVGQTGEKATATTMAFTQVNWLTTKLKEIMAAHHRTKGMLELQQWLSDNDLEDRIRI